MKQLRESVTAVLLLLLLGCGALLVLSKPQLLLQDFRSGFTDARPEAPSLPDRLSAAAAGVESAVNKAVSRRTELITLYGGFQRLIGCEIVQDASQDNNVVRLKNGKLNFIARDAARGDPSPNAAIINDFAAYARTLEIPTLFVLAPQKISKYADQKPAGAVEFGNENSDRFLSLLTADVDTLDLREAFRDADGGHDAYFFNTDHHWTSEGAFLGFQQIAARLESGYSFPIDSKAADRARYETTLYPALFLGSQGKRVGPWYAGKDDFALLLPREAADGYTFEIPHKGITRSGSFEDAFLFREMLDGSSPYTANPYVAYTGGDYPLSIAKNQNSTGGKKILLLRQSFSCALAPFLSHACSQLDIIDPRYFEGSIREYAAGTRPDLILIVYAASDTCNEALFTPLADEIPENP